MTYEGHVVGLKEGILRNACHTETATLPIGRIKTAITVMANPISLPPAVSVAKAVIEAATVRPAAVDMEGPRTSTLLNCHVKGCAAACNFYTRICGFTEAGACEMVEARSIDLPDGGERNFDPCVKWQMPPEECV